MTAAERLRTEGRQEGRQEGQLEGKRGSIRQALEIRFGAVPEPVHQKLDLIVDAKRLSDLLGESIRCQSAGDFLRHLSGLG
jgi:predicted transposase YdaD